MKTWKISSRLYSLIGASVLVMLALLAVNRLGLTRLGQLQNESYQRTQDAGQLKQDSGVGAQAYRIIADTFINRQLDQSAKKWQAMSPVIDKALEHAAKVADTTQEQQWARAAHQNMTELRMLYTERFLPLVKDDAAVSGIAAVDDQIDKLIDQFDNNFSQLAASMQAEAQKADEEFDAAASSTRLISLASIVIGGLLLAALALAVSRSITGQLGMELSDAMTATQRIAEGDLSTRFDPASSAQDSLAANLTRMRDTLLATVTTVRAGSEGVATASAEIAEGNHDLSNRTEQQAAALEETAASMEQLSASVRQNAESATQANRLAMNASSVAVQGGEVVAQVVATMKGINESSRKIADIISVVDGIAFQTNILALNAAVEAARAGEQGRGFAVVASEVRSLAGRSADAAKEIKALISASVERVAQGSALVDRAGATMTEVVNSIQHATQLMAEISAANAEQSQGVAQVNETVVQMDQTTQQNAALVEQMAAAASSLQVQAQDLLRSVAVFNLSGVGRESSLAHAGAMRSRPTRTPASNQLSRPALVAPSLKLGNSSGVNINLDNAIQAHADWRKKLRSAAVQGEQLDAETISRDDCCEIGKWLHGAGNSKYGGKPTFVALIAGHKTFHQEAGKVARAVNAGAGERAEQMLASGTGFSQASNEVGRLIVQLKHELKIAA